MPQSLVKLPIHLVFSTKNRIPYLADHHQSELHKYLHGICRAKSCPAIQINGIADHVHILCCLNSSTCVADLVRDLKSSSSKWIHLRFQEMRDFQWQNGYGAFAVSESHIMRVKHYIADQKNHHKRVLFKDEFRKLCQEANMVIDERYVWE